MKKKLSLIMTMCIAVGLISGCSDSENGGKTADTTTATASSSAAETTTAAETATAAVASADETASTDMTASAAVQSEKLVNDTRPNTSDYTLKEVVVLSRHNIRAPLSSNGSVNELATPHEWFSI